MTSERFLQRAVKIKCVKESGMKRFLRSYRAVRFGWVLGLAALLAGAAGSPVVLAEYGDVVINNYSDEAGMRPVIFPHWFHRIRFRCKVCHADLGFKFQAGGNEINMLKIIDGEYCGACHNGDIAWSVENCDLCHSGKPGLKSRIMGGAQTTGPGAW